MTFCVPSDVGLRRLERVVLARLDVLERRAVEDDVDALARAQQAVAVAHVADQEADARGPVRDGAGRTASVSSRPKTRTTAGAAVEEVVDQARADGPGTAGDEDATAADDASGR